MRPHRLKLKLRERQRHAPFGRSQVSSKTMTNRRGVRALSRTMRELIDKGSSDLKAALAGLLRGADIAFTPDAKGVPQL
jgi:hypothetical protein